MMWREAGQCIMEACRGRRVRGSTLPKLGARLKDRPDGTSIDNVNSPGAG